MRSLAALSLIVWTGSARAQSEVAKRLELDWNAPADCSSSAEVIGEVERLLGVAAVPAQRVVARARISHQAHSELLELDVVIGDRKSRRELIGKTCNELAKATALVLALTIDPALLSRATPQRAEETLTILECPVASVPECPSEPPATLPAPVCTPKPPCEPQKPQPALVAKRAAFHLGLGVNVTLGALPEPLPAPEIHFGYRSEHARLELAAAVASARARNSEGSEAAGFELWTVFPRGCFSDPVGKLELSLCGGLEAGRLRAEGFGADLVYTRWSSWAAPALGVVAELPLGRSSLGLSLWGELPLVRTRFQVADTELFRASAVLVRAGLSGSLGVF